MPGNKNGEMLVFRRAEVILMAKQPLTGETLVCGG